MEVMPGYKQTEVGVIPEDWELKELGNIASITAGGTPSRKNPAFWGGDIPWITTSQIDFNKITSAEQYITEIGLKNSAAKLLAPGTLLLALYGQGKTRGKVCILGIQAATNQACASIDISSSFSREFVFHFLASQYDAIRGLSNSGSQENLNGQIVKSIPIPLPPTKAEQEAIAEVLSISDALIETLERLIAKKRLLKQGFMQKLLTGKKRLPGFIGEWEVTRFGDVVTQRNERIDPRKNGTQEFCIELEHIGSASGSLLGSTSTGEQSSLKSVFRADDVLFGKLRAYLRKYWWADRPGVCSTEIWVFSPRENLIHAGFLFQVVQTDRFIEAASSSYGTHMPRSDWNLVKNFEMPLPATLAEQEAITEVLSAMDAEIALLEAQLAKYRQLKQGLMQKLLTGRIRLV